MNRSRKHKHTTFHICVGFNNATYGATTLSMLTSSIMTLSITVFNITKMDGYAECRTY
jgi:hypothetical protein